MQAAQLLNVFVKSWIALSVAAASALAQNAEPPKGAQNAATGLALFGSANPRPFVGLESGCWNCHGQSANSERIAWLPDSVYDGWIRRDEMLIWAKQDKHSEAYAVLLTERTKEMARLMAPPGGPVAPLHRDKRCLACHSGLPTHRLDLDNVEDDFRVTMGVSCEGCHGPSGDPPDGAKGWYSHHQVSNIWRFLPATEKEQQFGYYDIHRPGAKIRLCLSCHLGNAELGRVVTHEMMAAGHPPLPGFEAAAFLSQQPPHWLPFSNKSSKLRQEFAARTGQSADQGQFPTTKTILTGAVVGLAESLRLTAGLCGSEWEVKDIPKPAWPELAGFACYACHHDLERPAWRQERAGGGPGRPLLTEWPPALVFIAADVAELPRHELEAKLQAVQDALQRKPFGDPAELGPAATAAADWLDSQATLLDAKELTAADAELALRLVCETAERQTLDYDSARRSSGHFAQFTRSWPRRRKKGPDRKSPQFPNRSPRRSPAVWNRWKRCLCWISGRQ